ncbi:MAG: translation initiation factor IF-3 [Elusimicrobiota bacterium]|jgi:translation initiation factor IF-3|nr:translation initiation factor IF-3 [Elusimicrobiota bacterium]
MEGRNIDREKRKREEFLINESIKYPEVRVLDEKESMVGILKTKKALELARGKNLDLIIITDKSNPPVARIIDYGKFLYEKEKQKKETKKKQKIIVIKEVKIRLKIGINDLNIKTKNIIRFLENGNKVKISVVFYGRELEHPDKGKEILNKIIYGVEGFGDIEKDCVMYGNQMILILAPKKTNNVKIRS